MKRQNKSVTKSRIILLAIIILMLVVAAFLVKGILSAHENIEETKEIQSLQEALRDQDSIKNKAQRVPVITYHRLCSDEYAETITEQRSLWVSESVFKKQMKYLHDNGFITLTMDEFYLWQTGEIEVPEKSVVITFDDGHYNVIKYGCPILRDYGFNATIFVIGGDLDDVTDKNREIEAIGRDVYPTLAKKWPELNVQSHSYKIHRNTYDDPVVYDMTQDQLEDDFDTQDSLYSPYGYHFEYFAYPYGFWTNDLVLTLRERGYKMAFTYGEPGYASREDNQYLVPRIGIRGDLDMEEAFLKWFKEI